MRSVVFVALLGVASGCPRKPIDTTRDDPPPAPTGKGALIVDHIVDDLMWFQVDDRHVYWATRVDGGRRVVTAALARIPIDANRQYELGRSDGPLEVLGGGAVVGVQGNQIVALRPGYVDVLVDAASPVSWMTIDRSLDEPVLVWSRVDGFADVVEWRALAGGPTRTARALGLSPGFATRAVTAGYIWISVDGADGASLRRISRTTGAVELIATAKDHATTFERGAAGFAGAGGASSEVGTLGFRTRELRADRDGVVWLTHQQTTHKGFDRGALIAATDAAPAARVIARDLAEPRRIFLTSDAVYWLTTPAGDGAVHAVDRAAGTPRPAAATEIGVIHGDALYFDDASQIRRLAVEDLPAGTVPLAATGLIPR
jgi:hypothetical protein